MILLIQLNQVEVLKGKKVLATAGLTWVAIDRVRVITSIFSGETGLRCWSRNWSENDSELSFRLSLKNLSRD